MKPTPQQLREAMPQAQKDREIVRCLQGLTDSDALDADVARSFGVAVAYVRRLRLQRSARHRIQLRAGELAALMGWEGTADDVVLRALDVAIRAARAAKDEATAVRRAVVGVDGQGGRRKRPEGVSEMKTRDRSHREVAVGDRPRHVHGHVHRAGGSREPRDRAK